MCIHHAASIINPKRGQPQLVTIRERKTQCGLDIRVVGFWCQGWYTAVAVPICGGNKY